MFWECHLPELWAPGMKSQKTSFLMFFIFHILLRQGNSFSVNKLNDKGHVNFFLPSQKPLISLGRKMHYFPGEFDVLGNKMGLELLSPATEY